jgi:hypothetical protein
MDAAAADPAGVAPGRTRLGAHARSRGALSTQTVSGGAWNVAIFCADPAAGVDPRRLLQDTLAALGLRVQCHVRQWGFAELGEICLVGEAADQAVAIVDAKNAPFMTS